MPEIDEQESGQENELESPPPTSQEGYAILILVTADGYTISQEPLPATPSESEPTDDEPITDTTALLKHVLAIIHENPLGDNANEQLESGYHSA